MGWDASQLYLATQDINTAYSADQSIGYLGTAIQNDYICDSYAGVFTGNGWDLHVHINGEGLENALMPLAFSALMSPTISQNAHYFQNQYGTACTWVGAY